MPACPSVTRSKKLFGKHSCKVAWLLLAAYWHSIHNHSFRNRCMLGIFLPSSSISTMPQSPWVRGVDRNQGWVVAKEVALDDCLQKPHLGIKPNTVIELLGFQRGSFQKPQLPAKPAYDSMSVLVIYELWDHTGLVNRTCSSTPSSPIPLPEFSFHAHALSESDVETTTDRAHSSSDSQLEATNSTVWGARLTQGFLRGHDERTV